jgi:SAM-dependent methyltransferase
MACISAECGALEHARRRLRPLAGLTIGAVNLSPHTAGERSARYGDCTRCPVCAGCLAPPLLNSPDRLHGVPGRFSVARCEHCGVGVTLPASLGSDRLAAFYPNTYGAYELPIGIAGLLSRSIQRLQSWRALRTPPLLALARMPPGRLLDVGCGRGDLGEWLIRRGWTVDGVEPSAPACALATRRGIHARAGTLAEVELEPEAFDAVVFRQSLEHVSDPVADLRRAHAALRDGGVLAISVPNFACWQRRRFGGAWFHLDVPRHRFHFDPVALRGALARAGFDDVQIFTSSSTAGLPASLQYALAGRCLFPGGMGLRLASGACALTLPLSWMLARMAGEGDVLHAVAYRDARTAG